MVQRFGITLFTLLLCSSAAMCDFCISVADLNCTIDGSCTTGNGCGSTTFTVPTSASYRLRALSCSCTGCTACATITKSGVTIAHVETCNAGGCDQNVSVTLYAGITYQLWVCKVTCPFDEECANCTPTNCDANASVYLLSNSNPCP